MVSHLITFAEQEIVITYIYKNLLDIVKELFQV